MRTLRRAHLGWGATVLDTVEGCMRASIRRLLVGALLCSGAGLGGCGNETVVAGFGDIVLTGVFLDGTPGPGCSVGAPGPFPSNPTEFVITGAGFGTIPGNQVTVRFYASSSPVAYVPGPLPFLGGTFGIVDVTATVFSDTLICGTTPDAVVCGVATIDAFVEAILLGGVRDDSVSAPTFVITFAAPVIASITPDCFGSLTPTPFTITGTGFGPDGPVTIRLFSNDTQAIFNDGTAHSIDIQGTVTGGLGTTITSITPRVTNNVTPAANPLQSVSDALESVGVQLFLRNGSCSVGGPAAPDITFNRPEGDGAIHFSLATSLPAGLAADGSRLPQTIPSTFRIRGSDDLGPPLCPDPFEPVGGVVRVVFSRPTGGPALAFRLDANGVGTSDFDVVDATIEDGLTIVGKTPRVNAAVDFVPDVRIVFEDGTIAPVTPLAGPPATFVFTWDAAPRIASVVNLEAGTGNGIFTAGVAAGEFLGTHSSTMQVTGTNFDPPIAGPPAFSPSGVLVFDRDSGTTLANPVLDGAVGVPNRPLGTGNPAQLFPGNDLGDQAIPNPGAPTPYTVTATTISGDVRIEPLLDTLDLDGDGLVTARIRVTNPDGQIGEADVTWRLSHASAFLLSAAQVNNDQSATIDPSSILDPAGFNVVPPAPQTFSLHDFSPPNLVAPAPGGIGGLETGAAARNGANFVVVSASDTAPGFFTSQSVVVHRSLDGGANWVTTTVGPIGSSFPDGLPAGVTRRWAQAAFDRMGVLWVSYGAQGLASDTLVLLRSFDKGATFSLVSLSPQALGSISEPGLAVGFGSNPTPPGAASDGEQVAVAWADQTVALGDPGRVKLLTLIAHSNHFAAPLSGPVVDVAAVADASLASVVALHARPAIGPTGELYVTWTELDLDTLNQAVLVDLDPDGRFDATFDFALDQVVDPSVSIPGAGNPAAHPDTQFEVSPEPVVVQAGANAGRLVVAYGRLRAYVAPGPADLTEVVTRYSDDFGSTGSWSEPVSVGGSDAAYQWVPAICSDRLTGRLYVSWYDTRDDFPAQQLVHRYGACSTDGAAWGDAGALSTTPSDASAVVADTDFGIQAGMSAFGGIVIGAWAESSPDTSDYDSAVRVYEQSPDQSPP